MKGLILSLALFAVYVMTTAILSHILRPRRYSKLFSPTIVLFCLLYGLVYWLTPGNLSFLPPGWMAAPPWLDALAGLIVLMLNYFSYIDWFFGFNGGFSASLLLELLRQGDRGESTDALIQRYIRADGTDKIYGWRVPRLEETGYLVQDRRTGLYQLTPKGRIVAWLTLRSKRLLNLGAGG